MGAASYPAWTLLAPGPLGPRAGPAGSRDALPGTLSHLVPQQGLSGIATISLFFQLIYVSATLSPFPDTPHLGPSVTPSLCPVASSPHPTSPKAILPGPRRVTAPHRRDAHHAPCARGLCASQALSITSLNPRNHSTKMNIVILVFQIRN